MSPAPAYASTTRAGRVARTRSSTCACSARRRAHSPARTTRPPALAPRAWRRAACAPSSGFHHSSRHRRHRARRTARRVGHALAALDHDAPRRRSSSRTATRSARLVRQELERRPQLAPDGHHALVGDRAVARESNTAAGSSYGCSPAIHRAAVAAQVQRQLAPVAPLRVARLNDRRRRPSRRPMRRSASAMIVALGARAARRTRGAGAGSRRTGRRRSAGTAARRASGDATLERHERAAREPLRRGERARARRRPARCAARTRPSRRCGRRRRRRRRCPSISTRATRRSPQPFERARRAASSSAAPLRRPPSAPPRARRGAERSRSASSAAAIAARTHALARRRTASELGSRRSSHWISMSPRAELRVLHHAQMEVARGVHALDRELEQRAMHALDRLRRASAPRR